MNEHFPDAMELPIGAPEAENHFASDFDGFGIDLWLQHEAYSKNTPQKDIRIRKWIDPAGRKNKKYIQPNKKKHPAGNT